MATAHQKLAGSLRVLKTLQERHVHAIQVNKHPELTRTHRERLERHGFLRRVTRGWYIPSRPDEAEGDTTPWYAGMREFTSAYCNSRFRSEWHLSPEQSLLFRCGITTYPKQLQIHSPKANNQLVSLPDGCSLFLYRLEPGNNLLPADIDNSGLRVVVLPVALTRVSQAFFERHPLEAQICLRMVDVSQLLRVLLDGGQSIVAGRLAGALRACGLPDQADEIVKTMRSAEHQVSELNPFVAPVYALPGGRELSPYVQRIQLMWSSMRATVVKVFGDAPSVALDAAAVVADIEQRKVADAYHSLSIEGYRVTENLIAQIASGRWSPETSEKDKASRDALAARGYIEAHKHVTGDIADCIRRAQSPGTIFRKRLSDWYLALFSPCVAAGLLKASDLAGYRNDQVYIKNALHVPVPPEAVRDCMPALMDLLEAETHPAVRAVLGHFVFVFVHPYMDGNGRIARLAMNLMLTTGGYSWTIVPIERRRDYMEALEQASSFGNISPFAQLVWSLVQDQKGKLPLRVARADSTSIVRGT